LCQVVRLRVSESLSLLVPERPGAPDCQTLISQWVTVRTEATLLRLLKASGATLVEMDEIERDMKQQGRGSTFIDANETGLRLLRILPQP
jgi:hypothetical protein